MEEVRFVGLVDQRKQWFVELDPNCGRHRNVIGRTEKGVLYKKKMSRLNLIAVTQNGGKISVDIYPILKEHFPQIRVDKKLIDHMRKKLYNIVFPFDESNVANFIKLLKFAIT